ncbi:carboxymuconolactone decarboxylase family protein, partial [Streptomyces sp. URMC 123]|uniref:carboxymuconolactone decarboxylase family protein n=1 Tax=Streptomyces sp. URMC 123 TaxID=3423403 RepID=UPI003F1A8E14
QRAATPSYAPGEDPYARGLRVRREVLGEDAAPAPAGGVAADFHDLVTRHAWGEVWSRPGLDRRTRAVVALTALTTGGHLDELPAHTRAALRAGLTPDEIGEVLLQTALYCGMPTAGAAFRAAWEIIEGEAGPA